MTFRLPNTVIVSLRAKAAAVVLMASTLTGCEGAFDWVYDNPSDDEKATMVAGQFYVDASDWKKWHYLDLPTAAEALRLDASHNVSDDIVTFDIPFESTGEVENERGDHRRDGQYLYYFDVFNEGISKNHFVSFTPTSAQPEPESWTIAMHRNNVRTNGCGAYETSLTDIDLATREMCESIKEWQHDEWSENEVWDDQATMLSCLVPSQGITVNRVLSSWLTMEIPPMPPSFSMNSHVMLIRLPDGTFGALQLVDYLSTTNRKCCLTVKYKYPL